VPDEQAQSQHDIFAVDTVAIAYFPPFAQIRLRLPLGLTAQAIRTIGLSQPSADNIILPTKRGHMSSQPPDHLQAVSEAHFRLLEEVQWKPDLPLAMHEAGHAFAYEHHGIRVSYCVLERFTRTVNGEPILCGGLTVPANRAEIRKHNLWQEVVCIMTGPAAQHAVDEKGAIDSAIGDMQRAAEFIESVGLNQQQADELILGASKAAATIMAKSIATVRKIADVLEQKKRIEGDEIREIIRRDKENA
jgi:hypothetical protein